jgi:hypothetical protein
MPPDQSHHLDQHPHGERADDIDGDGGVGKAAAEQVPDRNVDQITGDRARHATGGYREHCGDRHERSVLRPDFDPVLAQVRPMFADSPSQALVIDHKLGPPSMLMLMLAGCRA